MENRRFDTGEEIMWTAPEFVFNKKTNDWYWWFGTITAVLIGTAVYLENYLFVFVILIGGFSLLLHAIRPPRTIEYKITRHGLSAGGRLYPFGEMTGFDINVHKDEQKETLLLILTNKIAEPILTMPLAKDTDIDQMRHFLVDYVPEQKISRPLSQIVTELIGL